MMNMNGMMGSGGMMGGGDPGFAPGQMGNMMGQGYGGGMQNPGYMYGSNGYGPAVNNSGGLDFTSFLGGILGFAVNILEVLIVVGLIVGIALFLKRYLFDGSGLALGSIIPQRPVCSNCGQPIQTDWNCCPKCGQVKKVEQPITAQNIVAEPVAPVVPAAPNKK